jgi:transposase
VVPSHSEIGGTSRSPIGRDWRRLFRKFAHPNDLGRRAAAIYSLIETAKLNGINPQLYIADVLTRIADQPARRIAELLPWNWTPAPAKLAA